MSIDRECDPMYGQGPDTQEIAQLKAELEQVKAARHNYAKQFTVKEFADKEYIEGYCSDFAADYALALYEKGELQKELEQATQREKRLREALQLLHDNQNGCPLPKYETDWNRAMELSKQALTETKEPLPGHGL